MVLDVIDNADALQCVLVVEICLESVFGTMFLIVAIKIKLPVLNYI